MKCQQGYILREKKTEKMVVQTNDKIVMYCRKKESIKNYVSYKFEVKMCVQSVFMVTGLPAIPGISIVAEFKIHTLKYR